MKYLNVKMPVSIFRQGKRFVAYSPLLDLSTSGKTLTEVRRRFAELVDIFSEERPASRLLVSLQRDARRTQADRLTMRDIDREIAAVRKAKRSRDGRRA